MVNDSKQTVNVISSTVERIIQIINPNVGGPNEKQAQRNRKIMLEKVKHDWVKGVLEKSLHGAVLIELGLEEQEDAVEHPWDMVLQRPDQPNHLLPPETTIGDVFNEMGPNPTLLILGEPGSGKTTMLLELAREMITQAEEDPEQPIPVVFHLSSWAEKKQSISEWLVEEFNTKYSIPKKFAYPWVKNDQLLLLLDGLDEVNLEVRDECVQAINAFLQDHLVPLVVCSRTKDYGVLDSKLWLQTAVLLQPLTSEQIHDYLSGLSPELDAVRRMLEEEPTLHELAQSPLMLSIMILAYQGVLVEDIQVVDSPEAHRKHVFDTYIRSMFRRRRIDERYSPEQTHPLAFLAGSEDLTARAGSVFD